MSWATFGYSIVGLLGLALIGRWLRLGESRISSPERAQQTAELLLAGFVAHDALVGTDGNAALVAGSLGPGTPAQSLALLVRRGTRVAARPLMAPLRLMQDVEGIRIESGDRLGGGILLFGITDVQIRALEAAVAPPAMARPLTIH